MKEEQENKFWSENVLILAVCLVVVALGWLFWPGDEVKDERGQTISLSHLAKTERLVSHWFPVFHSANPYGVTQKNLVVAPAPRPLITPAPGLPASGFTANGQVIVAPRPAQVGATVVIGGRALDLQPDVLGRFPRQSVAQQSTVQIQLKTSPGASVGIQALDGGVVNGKVSAFAQSADANGQIGFQFTVAKNPGSYRVAILVDGSREFFDFWVGPQLPAPIPAKST